MTAVYEPPDASRGEPLARCHFELRPPRNFLYPAILLLLRQQPRHGYRLANLLPELGFGEIDAPNIYRALGQLQRDRLVQSSTAPQTAGLPRRVYQITERGNDALAQWMIVIAEERERLGRALRLYAGLEERDECSASPSAASAARSSLTRSTAASTAGLSDQP
jgi:DNA-binding PadR family transcriptional regulator